MEFNSIKKLLSFTPAAVTFQNFLILVSYARKQTHKKIANKQ